MSLQSDRRIVERTLAAHQLVVGKALTSIMHLDDGSNEALAGNLGRLFSGGRGKIEVKGVLGENERPDFVKALRADWTRIQESHALLTSMVEQALAGDITTVPEKAASH